MNFIFAGGDDGFGAVALVAVAGQTDIGGMAHRGSCFVL
jgi:hypothetical protein